MDGFGYMPRAENSDMGSPAEFARVVGGLGIGNDATVIVYDTPTQRMGMVAWAFLYYGHADVRILDGGIAKWLAEGRALETQSPQLPPVTYSENAITIVDADAYDARRERDVDELRTAIANLLDNAVKYSPGTPHMRAGALCPTPRGRVKDTGSGIPRAQLDAFSIASIAFSRAAPP